MAIIGYWRLNGNSNDSSGNGYNGTDTDITYIAGVKDSGASFNGSSSNIEITGTPFYFANATFVVSTWVKYSAQTGLLCAVDCSSAGWGLWVLNSGYARIFTKKDGVNNSILYTDTIRLINDDKYHHILAIVTTDTSVVANNVAYLYVDGVCVGSQTASTYAYGTPSKSLTLGIRNTAGGIYTQYYFSGKQDELKIDNSLWSPARCKNEYSQHKGFF